MLEFNQEHKLIDLSTIKEKTNRSKNAGKVTLCGILVSSVLLLSGCSHTHANASKNKDISSTAIIMENGNAIIVDLQSYEKYVKDIGSIKYDEYAMDKNFVLYTSSGDKLIVDFASVKIIEGENSHEKAEFIAESLINENGQITDYDEKEYSKTK